MGMIVIGAVDLPDPASYDVQRSDLDSENTGRSEAGVLQRDRVRAGVYKLSLTFRVTKTDLKVITDALAPVSFSCTFFDPTTSSAPTKTMYAGDRRAKMIYYPATGETRWELSVDLIEF